MPNHEPGVADLLRRLLYDRVALTAGKFLLELGFLLCSEGEFAGFVGVAYCHFPELEFGTDPNV